MKNIKIFSIFLIFVFLMACEENGLDSTNFSSAEHNLFSKLLPELNFPDNISYSFYIYQDKGSFLTRVKDSVYSIEDRDYDNFNYAYLFADAGKVYVGNNSLSNNNGSYFSNSPVKLDGSKDSIVVQGGKGVPAFKVDIEMPYNFCDIITPTHNQFLDMNDDLSVTWTPEDSKNMIVVISLSNGELDTKRYGNYDIIVQDNGLCVIPSTVLKQFGEGITDITIRRGNYIFGIAPNYKTYGAFVYSRNSISVRLY